MAQTYTDHEILLAIPRTYLDLSQKYTRLYDCPEDKLVVIELTVTSATPKEFPRRCVAIKCTDSRGQSTEGTVYAESWRWQSVHPGDVELICPIPTSKVPFELRPIRPACSEDSIFRTALSNHGLRP